MSRRRRQVTAALAAMAAAVAAGCGGGGGGEASKSAAAIAADASRAASAARSVHISGTASAQGQAVPLDLHVGPAGATGTATFGGAHVQIVATGSNLYVRGAQQVLGGFLGAGVAQKIDNHWVQLSTSMPQLAVFAGLTSMQALVKQFLSPTATPKKGSTGTVGRQEVINVAGYGADGTGSLRVATHGTPYPVQLTSTAGALTFSDWGAPVTVTVPSDVIPLASLTG